MIQVLVISMVAAMALHDGGARAASCDQPVGWEWVLIPLGLIAALTHAFIAWCGRRLDHTGRGRHIANADSVLMLSRLAIAAVFSWAVLCGGWMETVRGVVGDRVLIDELLIIAPPIVALAAGWFSYYAIDRRLREATLMGVLDAGAPVRSLPTRIEYVSDQFRHQVLIILAPLALVTAWSESLDRAARWAAHQHPELTHAWWAEWALGALHFGGVILLFAVMPLGLRLIWRTVRLGPGETRSRLESLCARQGVRCRDFLVWRTHTDMVNGALVGILPRLRYILLTDALLERLDQRQVEAVMAHEVAHARRHHVPWLLACVISSVFLGAGAIQLLDVLLHRGHAADETVVAWRQGIETGIETAMPLLLGLAVFGWVSRRFERQADAFAAQHLSGFRSAGASDSEVVIQPEAVEAMSGALTTVARLAHLPLERFSFRHGSIAMRRRNLQGIVGKYADQLVIDRVVRRIKLAAMAGLVVTGVLMAWSALAGHDEPGPRTAMEGPP